MWLIIFDFENYGALTPHVPTHVLNAGLRKNTIVPFYSEKKNTQVDTFGRDNITDTGYGNANNLC